MAIFPRRRWIKNAQKSSTKMINSNKVPNGNKKLAKIPYKNLCPAANVFIDKKSMGYSGDWVIIVSFCCYE